MSVVMRSRWAAIGAALAVTLGAGGVAFVANASGGTPTSFIPIVPCRLIDTRPAPSTVGGRGTPVGPDESYAVVAQGASGQCDIPTSAVAVSMNVTIVGPTANGYLTVYPSDASVPNASNINFRAAQGATANAVTSALSADGGVSFFNKNGTVNVIADIVGYFDPASAGPAGPQGPTGATGATGATGPAGPQGGTGAPGTPAPNPVETKYVARTTGEGEYTTVSAAMQSITNNGSNQRYLIKVAPGTYSEPGPIVLRDYVDIEGSGTGVTMLTCSCGANSTRGGEPPYAGESAFIRANGAIHSQVRSLTIANTDNGVRDEVVGVWMHDSTSATSLFDVHVRVGGAHLDQRAIDIDGGAPSLDRVSVTATGTGAAQGGYTIGIETLDASATMSDIDVSVLGGADGVSWGITNVNGTIAMHGIRAEVTGGSGDSENIAIEDSGGTLVDVTVVATADSVSNLASNIGLDLFASDVRDASITATANAGTNRAVRSGGGPSYLNAVTALADGGTDAIGFFDTGAGFLNSTPTAWITASDLSSINGSHSSIGVLADEWSVSVIRASTVAGPTSSVTVMPGGSALISASGLLGGLPAGQLLTCRDSVVADTLDLLDVGCFPAV